MTAIHYVIYAATFLFCCALGAQLSGACVLHRWGRWGRPKPIEIAKRGDDQLVRVDTMLVQERDCRRCGKIQHRALRSTK